MPRQPPTHYQKMMTFGTEGVFQAQAELLVKKAITQTTPDWSTILQILGIIEAQANTIPFYIEIICKYLQKGKKTMKTNCLILIDALFKNSKRTQLQFLQSRELTHPLSDPLILNNPELRNFLCKTTPAWTTACAAQNCLNPDFAEWQESVTRAHFIPKLTDKIRKKMFKDVNASMEVLVMFSQCLIASFADGIGPEEPLLAEILPNVREIARRLTELQPTIVDPQLYTSISIERAFCDVCQDVMAEYKKTRQFDVNALLAEMAKAQNAIKKKVQPVHHSKAKKRVPPRHRGEQKTDISVEEFFNEFDKIKHLSQPQQLITTTDDLIDSLIEF